MFKLRNRERMMKKLRAIGNSKNYTNTLQKSFQPFMKEARSQNVGFHTRTGRLRNSLRQRIVKSGKNRIDLLTTTDVPYARIIEYKPRKSSDFRGPPYWLIPTLNKTQTRIKRRMRKNIQKEINKIKSR